MIDEFHTNPDVFVFLISTLAGGTGLNLTGIIFSAPRPHPSTNFLQGPIKL